jgi:hypothetical protein
MKLPSSVVWILLVIVCLLLVDFVDTMRHENAHKVIFEEYGCGATIEYGVQYKLFGGWTIPECPKMSESMSESLRESQAFVEAYGYQNKTNVDIQMMIFVTLLMLLIVVETRTRRG